jgi:hypothetical protein
MQPSSQTRFIALLVLTVVAIAGATFAILHRGVGRTASAASVAVVQPAAPAENPTEKPPAPTPPLATQPLQTQPLAGAPDDVTGFVSVAESEVAQLHSGVTLADWMSARGARERWTAAKPETQVDGPDEECLSLRRKDSLPSGAVVVRALYFYPPRVPSPIVFPKIDPSSPFSACTLAAVRLEAEAPAPANGHALAQAVAQRFTQTYGLSNDPEEVRRRRVKLWGEDGGHWVANIDITSSYDTKPGKDPDAPDQLIQGPVVRVSADLPHLDEMGNRSVLRRVDRPAEAAQFRRAVAAARVDAALSQRMEKLYELDVALGDRLNQEAEEMCKTRCPQDMPKPSGNDWREPLVPVLQDWFQALKAADPGRRAAGLLAADRLLLAFGRIRPGDHFGTQQSSTAEQAKLRTELQSLGAEFATGFEDIHYGYAGNWLLQSRDLDPDSEGGKLALLIWMTSGFDCTQAGPEGFREVISEGEALLAKNIDAQSAAEAHFRVGDAYSDIVAIAGGKSGANGEYDSSKYAGEAEADRAKALAHYRAGLAIDNTSQNAADAWRQAWHLSTGLVPGEFYVCFGD